MKSVVQVTALTFLMTLAFAGYSQRDHRGHHSPKPLEDVSTFSGQVASWASNDDFVYDGFYLQTGSEKLLVRFSRHMGIDLNSAIKAGNMITIKAVALPDTATLRTVRLVSISIGGNNIYNTPRPSKKFGTDEEFIFGSGKISHVQKDTENNSIGFILSDNTILRLPFSAADQLSTTATVGAYVSYTGYQVLRHGEYAPVYYTIVRCNSITINDKQYVIN